MAEKMRARVIRVLVDRRGGVLATDAEVGDQTLEVTDAGDLTAPGTVLVDDDAGTLLDYTEVAFVEDEDPTDLSTPDTVTLAEPLAVAIPAGTSLWVYEASADSDDPVVAEVMARCIPEDDEDAAETGEPVWAVVPRDYQDDLPPGPVASPGIPVVLEWDDEEDEWAVARIRGKGSRAIHFEHAEPAYTPTDAELSAGEFTRQLLHRNIVAKHGLSTTVNGVALGSDWWTLDPVAGVITVIIPDWVADAPADRRKFGWPLYAYRRGLAVDPPEVDMVLPLTTFASPPVTTNALRAPTWVGGDAGIRDASDATYVELECDNTHDSGFRFNPPDADYLPTPDRVRIDLRYEFTAGPTGGPSDLTTQWVVNGSSALWWNPSLNPAWDESPGIHTLSVTLDADFWTGLDNISDVEWFRSHAVDDPATWAEFWQDYVAHPDFASWHEVVSLGTPTASTLRIYELAFTYHRSVS